MAAGPRPRRVASPAPDATKLVILLHCSGGSLGSVCRPRILITSAQVQHPEVIEAVRAELGLEVFNFYGALEVGRIAWECPAHEGLHINLDHLIVECLDEPGGAPEAGTVVVTAIDRRAMPFLRYRLGCHDW